MRTKDWRDGDLVFINSTCYDEGLMAKIATLASKGLPPYCYRSAILTSYFLAGMKKGSFFVTLTKRLPCPDFAILEYELCRMSWGDATIFIMQKTTDPRTGNPDEEEDEEDEGN